MEIETNTMTWDEAEVTHPHHFRVWRAREDQRLRIHYDVKYQRYTPQVVQADGTAWITGQTQRSFAAAEALIRQWLPQLPPPAPQYKGRTSREVVKERWATLGVVTATVGLLAWAFYQLPL